MFCVTLAPRSKEKKKVFAMVDCSLALYIFSEIYRTCRVEGEVSRTSGNISGTVQFFL